MTKFKPYFEINLPKAYSPEERQSIAAELIDELRTRTESGLDKNGNKFKHYAPYSEEYIKFKGQSNIDLTYSGSMLNDIQLLQSGRGFIRIGYPKDYDQLGKVEGNVLGTYGRDKASKPRNFLGVTKEELKSILSNYPIANKQERRDRVKDVKAADIVAQDILDNVGFDIEE